MKKGGNLIVQEGRTPLQNPTGVESGEGKNRDVSEGERGWIIREREGKAHSS